METTFVIRGMEDDGSRFLTYQSGFNRLNVIQQFRRYYSKSFKVLSVTPYPN